MDSEKRVHQLLPFGTQSPDLPLRPTITRLDRLAEVSMGISGSSSNRDRKRAQVDVLSLLGIDFLTFDHETVLRSPDVSPYIEALVDRHNINRRRGMNQITARGAAMVTVGEFLWNFGSLIRDSYFYEQEQDNFATLPEVIDSLANFLISIQPLKGAPDIPAVHPVLQQNFLTRDVGFAIINCFTSLAQLSAEQGRKSIGKYLIQMIAINDSFRSILSDILQSNSQQEKIEALNFLDAIAQDVSFSGSGENTQSNKSLLGTVLDQHQDFANVVLQSETLSSEEHPDLASIFSPLEKARRHLLSELDDMAFFKAAGGQTGVEVAISSLTKSLNLEISPLAYVKTYLLDQNDDNNYATDILLWILKQAIVSQPELFGAYTEEINQFLQQVSLTQQEQLTPDIPHNELVAMKSNRQGDIFSESNQARLRLEEGAPIVADISSTGLGDLFLMLPAFTDIANTIRKMNGTNKFTIVVTKKLQNLVADLFKDFPFVTVLGQEYVYSHDEQVNENRKNAYRSTLMDAAIDNGHPGIILEYSSHYGFKFTQEDILQSNINVWQHLETTTPEEHIEWGMFRRRAQGIISHIFHTTMFDPDDRDNIEILRNWLADIAKNYENNHTEHLAAIEGITQTHKGGYICIIDKGSTAEKEVIPSTVNVIIDTLQPFCQTTDTAIVVVHSNKLNSSVTQRTRNGVRVYETGITADFGSTFSWLTHAAATIGPDTFLTHVAEYFTKPVLNMHIDSNPIVWSLDERVHWVAFAIAHELLLTGATYNPHTSRWYSENIMKPFTLPSGRRNRKWHPLILAAHKAFEDAIREALEDITTLISNTKTTP